MITPRKIRDYKHNKDYYPTPPWATEALFRVVKFNGDVLEGCCGAGDMSKVIEKYNTCISSDLINRGYGQTGIDFLKITTPVNNIITNPPYTLASEFLEHSLKLARFKVAFLLNLTFLESVSRYSLLKASPLEKVYVFTNRLTLLKNGIGQSAGKACYAWFVWNNEYRGKSQIDWIPPRNTIQKYIL